MNWEGWHKINDTVQDAVQAVDHFTMFLHMSLDLPEESEAYLLFTICQISTKPET